MPRREALDETCRVADTASDALAFSAVQGRPGIPLICFGIAAYPSFHVRVCSLSSASETWTATGTGKRGRHREVHQQAFRSGGCNFLKAWTAFGRRQLVLSNRQDRAPSLD